MFSRIDLKNFFNGKKQYITVTVLFLVLVLVNTFPSVLHLCNAVIGDFGDSMQNMWNFWWMKEAVTHLQNPYFTPYLYYPQGSHLWLHTLSPIESLISIPLQYIFKGNLILTYNIIVIACLTFSGTSMYALTCYLAKSKFASFVAGYLVIFSPYMAGHTLGHLNLIAIQWMPLFILFFIKFHRNPNIKNVFFSGLFFLLVYLASFNQVILILIFAFIYIVYHLYKNKLKVGRSYFLKILAIFLIPLLLVWPLFYNSIIAYFSKTYEANPSMIWATPEILTFIIPGPLSTYMKLASGFFASQSWVLRIFDISPMGAENENFIGYTVLVILIYGLLKYKNTKIKSWFAVGCVFFVFALGGVLKIFGYVTPIKLPYLFIYKIIPFLSLPGRFSLMISICFAIACAIAIKHILTDASPRKRIYLSALIFICVFFEFQVLPYPTRSIPVADFYYTLAADNGDYAIYDAANLYRRKNQSLYFQTVHNKKMVSGYVSRTELKLLSYINNDPILSDIKRGNDGELIHIDDNWYDRARQKLQGLKVKYVTVTKIDAPNFRLDGFKNVYEDDGMIAYQIY